jgi:hypothetical protein
MLITNPWLAQTQYFNNPHAAGVADFATYRIESVEMLWSEVDGSYKLSFPDGESFLLTECDVVASGDPAASERRGSARTSKSATAVIARTPSDRIAIIEAQAGYVEPTKFFDWIFGYQDKYKQVLRTTYVEAQAGFKAFIPIGRREAALRGRPLSVQPIPALGEKATTIRNIFQPYLARDKLFVRKEFLGRFNEEFRVFPGGRMDLLDAIMIAIFKSFKPDGEGRADDDDDEERKKRQIRRTVSAKSGY